jgi:hypothetical protein
VALRGNSAMRAMAAFTAILPESPALAPFAAVAAFTLRRLCASSGAEATAGAATSSSASTSGPHSSVGEVLRSVAVPPQHAPPNRSQRIPGWWTNHQRGKAAAKLPDGSQAPWAPTAELAKRTAYPRRMRHILAELGREYEATVRQGREHIPKFGAGDVVTIDMVRVRLPVAQCCSPAVCCAGVPSMRASTPCHAGYTPEGGNVHRGP